MFWSLFYASLRCLISQVFFLQKIKNSAVGMIDRSLGFFFRYNKRVHFIMYGIVRFLFFFFNQNHPSWLEKSKMNDLLIQGLVQIVPIFDSENDSIIFLEEKLKKNLKIYLKRV